MPGPAPVVVARWAVKFGPLALPVMKRMYSHGRFRQLAILHARTLVDGQFSWEMEAGERVWVVWTGDTVVATYPEVAGTTDGLFVGARPGRRQDPDDVVVRRVRRRIAAAPRPSVPARLQRSKASDEEAPPVEGQPLEELPAPAQPPADLPAPAASDRLPG